MIYKIYGPPGTGKTYRLISRAKAYTRIGTPLNKIGYFAFTKKAAGEAKKRMPAEDKKLPYFQTLHSFAFNLLKLNEDDVMQPYHYENFGKKLNVKVKYYDRYNEEETFNEILTSGALLFHAGLQGLKGAVSDRCRYLSRSEILIRSFGFTNPLHRLSQICKL